jgi:hypothetical protein
MAAEELAISPIGVDPVRLATDRFPQARSAPFERPSGRRKTARSHRLLDVLCHNLSALRQQNGRSYARWLAPGVHSRLPSSRRTTYWREISRCKKPHSRKSDLPAGGLEPP